MREVIPNFQEYTVYLPNERKLTPACTMRRRGGVCVCGGVGGRCSPPIDGDGELAVAGETGVGLLLINFI